MGRVECGQGAPSTIRCIETCATSAPGRTSWSPVREHPAPSGALRHDCGLLAELVDDGVRERPAPPGALRRGHNQCLWPRWGNIKGVPRTARCSGCRRPLSGIPRKLGVLRNENPAFFVLGVVWCMVEPRNTNAESLMMSSMRSSPRSLRSHSMTRRPSGRRRQPGNGRARSSASTSGSTRRSSAPRHR